MLVGVKNEIKSAIRKLLPRSMHKHRIWTGPLRGNYIVTSWHDYPSAILGRNERPLLNWLRENVEMGQTWLDVGSHYGYVALALSNLVGESGRVFAFEPMLHTAGCVQQMRHHNHLPQLTIVPLGLGTPETLALRTLSTTRGMADSMLTDSSWKEQIYVARMDWLWPRICGENHHISGVKIDVQGMEIEVLVGLAALLQEHRPKLVIELHDGVSRADLLQLIDDVGYSRFAIPLNPSEGEDEPRLLNDRSYYFRPLPV